MANPMNMVQQLAPMPFQQQQQQQPQAPLGGNPMAGLGAQPDAAQPAKSKDELKQGWRGFFDRLAQDEALQNTLISFGATALQPRAPGSSQMAQLGQAALAGQQAGAETRQQQAQQEQQETTNAFRERQIADQELRTEQQGANVESTIETREGQQELSERELQLQERAQNFRETMTETESLLASAKVDQITAQTEALRAEIDNPGRGTAQGQSQQLALQAVEGMDEAEVAALGGPQAATVAWATYIDSRRNQKSPEEFRLDVLKELGRQPGYGGSEGRQKLEQDVAAWTQAYREQLTSPGEQANQTVQQARATVRKLRGNGVSDEQIFELSRSMVNQGRASQDEFNTIQQVLREEQ